jgi:hypothetical protein
MCAMSPRLLRPVATGFHPEANAWRSAVVANGGSVSASTMRAVSKFCGDIDGAGLRDRFYRLNLFCGTGLNAVLVPLYRGQSRTGTQFGNTTDTNNGPFVSADYVETGASGGLKGNGTSKYLNTGLPMDYPATNGDRHLAVYKNLNGTGTAYSLGVLDSASPLTLYQLVRFSSQYGYFSGGNTTTTVVSDDTGFWVGTGTVNRSLYRNGSSVGSSTNGSDTVNAGTRTFFVFARNSTGTPENHSAEQQCSYSIGLSMTASQVSSYNTAIQAFQTALGRNV